MARPRRFNNDRERKAYHNGQRAERRAAHNTSFVGIDGEGVGRGRSHRYVLLGYGDRYTSNPDGLAFPEIADFLYGCYRENPSVTCAGFYLGYDFTQWLKTLPENRARYLFDDKYIGKRLRHGPNPKPFPVKYAGWEFDILGMKRFSLRPEDSQEPWMYINDAGPFYQCSFLKAINPQEWIEPIVTAEEYAQLETGKARRDSAKLDQEMIDYMLLENNVFSRLMGSLNSGLSAMGVHLRKNQWFGPGQAAQAWLNTTDAPKTESLSPLAKWLDIARKAYFGGWFEIFAHGIVPGSSWEYDINSAYPHIARQLPCLLHGTWNHDKRKRYARQSVDFNSMENGGWNTLRILRANVHGSNNRLGSMLHRLPDGNICRPQNTEGYFWAHEICAAYRAGLIDRVDIHESWEYKACNCAPPLEGLSQLYENRLALGKDTPAGKSAKLIYNSAYGKFAQSVGNPRYGNALYASLITSGCRTQILDAIASHPDGASGVLMVATDAVFFRRPHPSLPISKRLGEWDYKERVNLTLFKPGVYWDDATRDRISRGLPAVFKSRGVNAQKFAEQIGHIDRAFAAWPLDHWPEAQDPMLPREGWFPNVVFNAGFSMITCKQALARHKWFLAGAIGEAEVEQDSWPGIKRRSGDVVDNVFYSRPYEGFPEPSLEYDKNFGLDEDIYLTEDGPGAMLIAEAMR